MRPFIHGWRQKSGYFLLGIAVTVTVCWFRSYAMGDKLIVPGRDQALSVESNNGAIHWRRLTPGIPLLEEPRFRWEKTEVRRPDPNDARHHLATFWAWAGFRYDAGPFYGYVVEQQLEMIEAPYWAIVLPLVLMSGWLILGTRRKDGSNSKANGSSVRVVESVATDNRTIK